ncbi:CD9 protein, partial [Polyodon spathula]|nr:CD9 protein [Polyodon spathula]
MLGLGLWLRFSSETRGFFDIDLNTQSFIIGVIVLISTGALMLLVAILGHCGLCNESRSTLGTFLVFVGVLCGAEIAAGVLAFVNKDALVQNLSEFYQTIYLQYLNKRDPSQAVTLRIFHNAAIQATSILACIFCFLSLIVFIAQLFTLPKGRRFTFTGVFQLLACLCIMIAASIYTNQFHTSDTSGWYGHSFILAWTAFALTFISTVIYFVLRKKTQ